jgi:hypothetical protein
LDDKEPGSPNYPETEEEFAATAKTPPLRDSKPPNLAPLEPARDIPVSALREPTWDTSTLPAPTISSSAQDYVDPPSTPVAFPICSSTDWRRFAGTLDLLRVSFISYILLWGDVHLPNRRSIKLIQSLEAFPLGNEGKL